MINGTTELLMMKADVLNSFDEIKVCTHYETKSGETIDYMPFSIDNDEIKPVYQTFTGWQKEITDYSSFDILPDALTEYISFIEKELDLPISVLSMGPDRTQTILR